MGTRRPLSAVPAVPNEWARLEEVVLGDATTMLVPARGRAVASNRLPPWAWLLELTLDAFLKGRRVPEWIRRRYEGELSRFGDILADNGVTVHRPRPVRPLPDEPPGLTQMFARDPIVVIGDRLFIARHREPVLRKEIRGFEWLTERLRDAGRKVVVMDRVAPDGAYLEGGDVLVDLPFVFVGVGRRASNAAGAAWLQQELGSAAEVVTVALRDPHAFHLDTCLTLTGPRRGIVYRDALQAPLPAPLDRYQLVDVSRRTYLQVGVNVFSLSPRTVCLQRRHKDTLGRRLQDQGFQIIPVRFDWHALAGGGLRCATHPLRRVRHGLAV
ncbi:MAG: hypothetical protein GF331_14330 [Chitinivibrionales bacterium]|nr:hypothetical protein [Chitinivibrionales bacterium]